MLSEEDGIKTLTQLGLTVLEARIYLALCKFENLKAKQLSKLTKTALTDTYRVLAKLQNKGLVEKIIKTPAEFNAVPIESSLKSLLHKKKDEYDDLNAKTMLLVRAVKEKHPRIAKTTPSQFVMIPQSSTVVKKIREAIDRSKKSVDIFLSWKRFLNGVTGAFAESSEKAWDRGVKFRIVVESPQEESDVDRALGFCEKSSLCNIRFLPGAPKTVLGIYDRNEVFIIIDPEEGLLDSPALWSNNRSLIAVVQDYFEMLWLISMENPKL